MKRRLYLPCAVAAIAAAMLSGCVKPQAEPESVEKLGIDKVEAVVGYAGGSVSLSVTSNTEWTVKSDVAWAVAQPQSGSGNATVNIKVAENTESVSDEAHITVSASAVSLTLQIKRKGRPKAGPQLTDIEGNSYSTTFTAYAVRCKKD